ncbi:ribonuclease H-like domain-containing protein [Tanacetum coccineum]
MTGDAANSSKPTELNFGITNIKAYIPIILDLEELNYDQWCELFTIHCKTFGVYGHLTGTMKSNGLTDEEWEKRDNLVKLWLYGTISTALVKCVLKKDLKACDIWKNLKDVLHDNKDARAMQLDTKLHMADLLANMEAPVSDKSLVTYTVNGLGNKFAHVASIIRHRDPFPTFDTARSMLLVEEILLNRDTTHQSLGSSSSPTVLIATTKAPGLLGPAPHQPTTRQAHSVSVLPGPTRGLVSSEAAFGPTGPSIPSGFCYAPSGPRVEYGQDIMITGRANSSSDVIAPGIYIPLSPPPPNNPQFFSPFLRQRGIKGSGIPGMKCYVLVLRPPHANVVRSIWLFKHKFHADGSLSRYKARLVANGQSQIEGIDCDETFSLVVKPATIRTVLNLALSKDWLVHQLDVKNGFLHGSLSEIVYMHQPLGFTDSAHPDYVCSETAYLLIYVDDIILTASSNALLQRVISLLHSEFAMTDLDPLNYFLGISATRTGSSMFLTQSKYANEVLKRAHMLHYNPCRTLVDTESKLGPDGDPVSDPTLYRSLAGAL